MAAWSHSIHLVYSAKVVQEIVDAVLSSKEIQRYPHQQIYTYLEELSTNQWYPAYRALKHPLYPILRKIERHAEHVERAQLATQTNHVIYVSNHKSHMDYLVELLVLDEHGIRPPIIAAGINLFNGLMGILNRHVTGALPVRRNSRDPAYLATLRAYVAELVHRRDLFLYPEGGRSYNGEFKRLKTGLLQGALQSREANLVIVPVAIAYDLVLEDQVLANQGKKRRQRPFATELAEMVRYAVGYESRGFITFGTPISLSNVDPESPRDFVLLTRHTRDAMGRLYKVLPTALLSAALRPSMLRQDLENRIDKMLEALRSIPANLGVESGYEAVEQATGVLVARGVIVVEGNRYRIRNRHVLRYYGRTLNHLLTHCSHSSMMH